MSGGTIQSGNGSALVLQGNAKATANGGVLIGADAAVLIESDASTLELGAGYATGNLLGSSVLKYAAFTDADVLAALSSFLQYDNSKTVSFVENYNYNGSIYKTIELINQ